MNEEIKARVSAATVMLENRGGQGVLVPGGMLLTAAHCVDWSHEGGMAMGDCHIEHIETAQGQKLKATPLAVEPVTDIAVLGCLDDEDCLAFERFCETTAPIPVSDLSYHVGERFPVFVYTHKRTWLTARASQWGQHGRTLFIEADLSIEGGTSGGPVVNDRGELVGIVSNSGGADDEEACAGSMPNPRLALPVWAWNMIRTAQAAE